MKSKQGIFVAAKLGLCEDRVTAVKYGTVLGRKKFTRVKCGWKSDATPPWEYSFFSFIVVKPFG
jgi:hypothetical protein